MRRAGGLKIAGCGRFKNCGVREIEKNVGFGRFTKMRDAGGRNNCGCGRLKNIRGAGG